jgi:hypothetical protein
LQSTHTLPSHSRSPCTDIHTHNIHAPIHTHTHAVHTYTDSPSPQIKRPKSTTPSSPLDVPQSPDGAKTHASSSSNQNRPDRYTYSTSEISTAAKGKTLGNTSVNDKIADTHLDSHESAWKDTSKTNRSSIGRPRIVPKVDPRSRHDAGQQIINIDDDSAPSQRVSSEATKTQSTNVQSARKRGDDDVHMIDGSPSKQNASEERPSEESTSNAGCVHLVGVMCECEHEHMQTYIYIYIYIYIY